MVLSPSDVRVNKGKATSASRERFEKGLEEDIDKKLRNYSGKGEEFYFFDAGLVDLGLYACSVDLHGMSPRSFRKAVGNVAGKFREEGWDVGLSYTGKYESERTNFTLTFSSRKT